MCTGLLLALAVEVAVGSRLQPGRTIRFTFPDLPPAYAAMGREEPPVTACTVRLPDDYEAAKRYPLFVYLDGGRGGEGTNTGTPRAIAGNTGVVVANFPLFRRSFDAGDAWNGIRVMPDDYSLIAQAYKEMTERIRKEVPNIDVSRSVMGGNSNGAHTLAVLLTMLDPVTLGNYRGYFFVDGGFEWGSYHALSKLRDHHFLFLVAEGRADDQYRPYLRAWTEKMNLFKSQYGLTKWRFETMKGLDHGLFAQHHPVIREWMTGVWADCGR